MTNQDAGVQAEDWLAWWRSNKHKTQEEWIREGFEQSGLTLDSPLTKEDIRSLLLVVGKTKEGASSSLDAPNYLRYNAMRWLRDSDFDPLSFNVSDLPEHDADAVMGGLIRFCRWSTDFPKEDAVGVLAIGEHPSEKERRTCGTVVMRWLAWGVYVFLALSVGGGILCLRLATRKLKPQTDVEAGDSGG
jgi:hypothetical protein